MNTEYLIINVFEGDSFTYDHGLIWVKINESIN